MPGLLAYVEHHLGVHHSPDLFHVQHERIKAVAAPMAVKQWAAEKALTTAEETLARGQEHTQSDNIQAGRSCPGRPPKATPSLARTEHTVEAARRGHQRLTQSREQVGQSIQAIGHTYHFVDLDRGVRRNGMLIASDIHKQIDTIRQVAQQEGLSESSMERIDKAERIVPKMQATIEFVSSYVRQQVHHLDLIQSESYAMHAHLLRSYDLERVVSTKTLLEGQPLRDLADRIRLPLFEPGGR